MKNNAEIHKKAKFCVSPVNLSYTLLIASDPWSEASSNTAFNFIYALLQKGHTLNALFFYRNAVNMASRLTVVPDDENNHPEVWQKFLKKHQVEPLLCIGSALRRGILDKKYAKQYGKDGDSISDNFEIGGLAKLFEAIAQSDRFIQFG